MFKVGQKVRVKKDGDEDSKAVANKIGTIARVDRDIIDGKPGASASYLLTFPHWAGGHSGDDSKGRNNRSFWYVNGHNVTEVKQVKKVKKARRSKKA